MLASFLLKRLRPLGEPLLYPLLVETSPSGTQDENIQHPHLKYQFLLGDSCRPLPSQNVLKEEIQHTTFNKEHFPWCQPHWNPALMLAEDFPSTKIPKSLDYETLWKGDDGEVWH